MTKEKTSKSDKKRDPAVEQVLTLFFEKHAETLENYLDDAGSPKDFLHADNYFKFIQKNAKAMEGLGIRTLLTANAETKNNWPSFVAVDKEEWDEEFQLFFEEYLNCHDRNRSKSDAEYQEKMHFFCARRIVHLPI